MHDRHALPAEHPDASAASRRTGQDCCRASPHTPASAHGASGPATCMGACVRPRRWPALPDPMLIIVVLTVADREWEQRALPCCGDVGLPGGPLAADAARPATTSAWPRCLTPWSRLPCSTAPFPQAGLWRPKRDLTSRLTRQQQAIRNPFEPSLNLGETNVCWQSQPLAGHHPCRFSSGTGAAWRWMIIILRNEFRSDPLRCILLAPRSYFPGECGY